MRRVIAQSEKALKNAVQGSWFGFPADANQAFHPSGVKIGTTPVWKE